MDIKEILRKQAEFDAKHASNQSWNAPITKENVQVLEHLIVCLVGEVGEGANIVKKVVKGDVNRVCLLKGRRFNPFFGLAEASWVLAGLNVLEPLRFFLATIEEYSDDGMTLNGAYGYRMRKALGMDQLEEVIRILKNDLS